jgi:transcriptional regulator with XRE-family HTH domain
VAIEKSEDRSVPNASLNETPAAELDLAGLATLIGDRRRSEGLSVRQAAAEAGVSFMTLSRVENGSQPDLATFVQLCAWLRVAPETFFTSGPRRETTTMDAVAQHLARDPRLDPKAAGRIAAMVRDMYDVLAREPDRRPAVACHLRAAAVLRPGVPERLASLLEDMYASLEAEGELV